jgi:hypothetical protein
MNDVYEITLYVICEMYNFIICEIYDSIFIYENSHTKLPKFTYDHEMDFICEISFFICELYNFIFDLIFIYENSYMNFNYQISHVKWISYMKFFFSYVNCITSYMT